MQDRDENRTHILRDSIKREAPDLTQREVELATKVAKDVWGGDTYCITAVRAGISAVKRSRE